MKQTIKTWTQHAGLDATHRIRRELDIRRRDGWPYCPADEGDVLYLLAKTAKDALEIGCATGSTAGYILEGLQAGTLTSVDWKQDDYEREGERLVAQLGCSARHTLIEGDSINVLPDLFKQGRRFDLIFLDGWKSFDRIWIDTFYSARMLRTPGYMMFDDARMPAVRKCIRLLERYYAFRPTDTYRLIGGPRLRAWHVMSARSFRRPYRVLEKTVEVDETDAARHFDFWRRF